MLMMFFLIIVGFVLKKKNILPDTAHVTVSKLETFVFVPAVYLNSMLKNCNVQTFSKNYILIIYGLITVVCAIALAYPLSALFVRNSASDSHAAYQRNIYKYALTFGNYGFMGNFIVLGIWGDEMFFKYSMFTFLIGVLCASWGLYVLVPKDDTQANILQKVAKGILTPPCIRLWKQECYRCFVTYCVTSILTVTDKYYVFTAY